MKFCITWAFCLLLFVTPASAAAAGPLTVTISTDKNAYAQSDTVHVTLSISNAGSTPIDVPVLDAFGVDRYIPVNVSTSSGIPIFFLSQFDEEASQQPTFQTIPPNGTIKFM